MTCLEICQHFVKFQLLCSSAVLVSKWATIYTYHNFSNKVARVLIEVDAQPFQKALPPNINIIIITITITILGQQGLGKNDI